MPLKALTTTIPETLSSQGDTSIENALVDL